MSLVELRWVGSIPARADLARLEAFYAAKAPPELARDIRKQRTALGNYLAIELTEGADGLPACIADDLAVVGCIIGDGELAGGPTVLALKVNLADRDDTHDAHAPAVTRDSAAQG